MVVTMFSASAANCSSVKATARGTPVVAGVILRWQQGGSGGETVSGCLCDSRGQTTALQRQPRKTAKMNSAEWPCGKTIAGLARQGNFGLPVQLRKGPAPSGSQIAQSNFIASLPRQPSASVRKASVHSIKPTAVSVASSFLLEQLPKFILADTPKVPAADQELSRFGEHESPEIFEAQQNRAQPAA